MPDHPLSDAFVAHVEKDHPELETVRIKGGVHFQTSNGRMSATCFTDNYCRWFAWRRI